MAAPARGALPAAVAAPARVAVSARVAVPTQGTVLGQGTVLDPGIVPGQGIAPARVVRPVGAQGNRSRAHRKVRLTRRGRLVVWALAALAVAAVLTPVWLLAATGAQAANHGLSPAAAHAGLRQVMVRPGQTLWSIAMAAEPTADPRVVTQEIMQVNALSSQVLVPGESLWVPAG